MKQTAVEWFFKWFNDNQEATHKEFAQAFDQAKEMEKEQNHAEYMRGWKDGLTKQETFNAKDK